MPYECIEYKCSLSLPSGLISLKQNIVQSSMTLITGWKFSGCCCTLVSASQLPLSVCHQKAESLCPGFVCPTPRQLQWILPQDFAPTPMKTSPKNSPGPLGLGLVAREIRPCRSSPVPRSLI